MSAVDHADDSPIHPIFASLTPGSSAHAVVGAANQHLRAYAASVNVAGEPFTIVALQIGPTETAVSANFLKATFVAIPLALALAWLGGCFLARRSFVPVIDMGRRTSAIDSEHLDARLPVRHAGDEMDELATIFNDLLARLERSFLQERQFMADASHELRTPIASLLAEVTVALSPSQLRTAREYQVSLEQVRHEARRLSAIVDDLFTLARLDANGEIVRAEEFFLEEVILERVASLRPMARDRGLELTFYPSAEARCSGDPVLVDRIITNVLDNAIKYVPPHGSVLVELESSAGHHVVRFVDDGTGIPLEAQPHVFDRFYRADAARTRSAGAPGGAGLGLSIARSIAQAHHGSLELTSSSEHGTVFTLTLPASSTGPVPSAYDDARISTGFAAR
jgi:heavy metal sensor kinase